MKKIKQLTTTFIFDRAVMERAAREMTPEEHERSERMATLIGPEAGALLGSGLQLLIEAEGREAAQADVIACMDSIQRLLRGN
ncbi:MAG TPA: hypothetical protein VE261_06130 [Gaiellaceae bacterium]|nr:hypothetical protein [Gaiellaceae bacterium]